MIDIAIGILTFRGSKWNAAALREELEMTLDRGQVSCHVEVFENLDAFQLNPLSPLRYLSRVWRIHNSIFFSRIQMKASLRVISWFLRQQFATLLSLLRLFSRSHASKVSLESIRAARISGGHQELLKSLSKVGARLFLILEDDVRLESEAELTELIRGPLMKLEPIGNAFSCELSSSFSFKELGVDDGDKVGHDHRLIRHSYPFTNTLAATILSSRLAELTILEIARESRKSLIQFDYEVAHVWSKNKNCVASFSSSRPLFSQQSEFRDNKLH